jgi:hypothetical protein
VDNEEDHIRVHMVLHMVVVDMEVGVHMEVFLYLMNLFLVYIHLVGYLFVFHAELLTQPHL